MVDVAIGPAVYSLCPGLGASAVGTGGSHFDFPFHWYVQHFGHFLGLAVRGTQVCLHLTQAHSFMFLLINYLALTLPQK